MVLKVFEIISLLVTLVSLVWLIVLKSKNPRSCTKDKLFQVLSVILLFSFILTIIGILLILIFLL